MNKVANEIYEMMGVPRAKRTMFSLDKVDEKQMSLNIKKGKIDFSAPWFGKYEKNEYALISANFLEALISALKTAQRENFELKLERSIWQHIPVDFGDVWSVAMDEIRHADANKEPDLDKIINKIKKEHPNLFVDIQNLMRLKRAQ